MVLSRQKNDINILADKAEWSFILAKENKWNQGMLKFSGENRGNCFLVKGAPGQGPALGLDGGLEKNETCSLRGGNDPSTVVEPLACSSLSQKLFWQMCCIVQDSIPQELAMLPWL